MNLRLLGIATFGAVLLFATSVSADAQMLDSSPVAKVLNQLVMGNKVRIKQPLVSDFVILHRSTVEPIDTAFYENGTVEYRVEEGRKDGKRYFVKAYELKDRSKLMQPGSEIQLNWKISYLPDSIEIMWFNNGPSGSISLMLAPGYETWPTDRIVNFLYKIISIPAIDERIALENQYKAMTASLKSRVDSAQPAIPPGTLEIEIEKKTALYRAYRDVADIATKLRSEHDPVISSDSTNYEALAEGVENQLVTLRAAAEAERKQKAEEKRLQAVHDLRQQAANDEASLRKMFLELDKSEPRLEADLTKRSQALQSAQEVANDWQKCVSVLTFGHEDATADAKKVDAANEHIKRLQAALDASRSRIQSRSTDMKYDSMVSKLAQLKSAYAASFGTPGAEAAKANLRSQLGQMIANRESAAAAGSAVANQQAEQLRAELNRLH
jgi:hypothetical protein